MENTQTIWYCQDKVCKHDNFKSYALSPSGAVVATHTPPVSVTHEAPRLISDLNIESKLHTVEVPLKRAAIKDPLRNAEERTRWIENERKQQLAREREEIQKLENNKRSHTKMHCDTGTYTSFPIPSTLDSSDRSEEMELTKSETRGQLAKGLKQFQKQEMEQIHAGAGDNKRESLGAILDSPPPTPTLSPITQLSQLPNPTSMSIHFGSGDSSDSESDAATLKDARSSVNAIFQAFDSAVSTPLGSCLEDREGAMKKQAAQIALEIKKAQERKNWVFRTSFKHRHPSMTQESGDNNISVDGMRDNGISKRKLAMPRVWYSSLLMLPVRQY
jgi:hypothetical protein